MDKKSSSKKVRKISEESSSSSYTTSSFSSDDESDTCDIKPIKEYLRDRKEMAHQLFNSVKPEKIRMMLPQVLKKMDLNELEEWCASELSGMSRARILSILNGQPLLESSDSDDTNDSGPSLEIISDTEEWPTEDESVKKEDKMSPTSKKVKLKKDKMKFKSKPLVQKKNDKNKARSKLKVKHKLSSESAKFDETKVKKEGEKVGTKDKEGDSLLDLLELEMRARAIRALIRKEEDIIPTVPSAQGIVANSSLSTSVSTSKDRSLSLRRVEEKLTEMDKNYREVITTNTDATQVTAGEDEDVVLVVQPTLMIELLSSGSDDEEQGKRRNQKLENERTTNKVQNMDILMDGKTDGLNSGLNNEDTVTVNDKTAKSSDTEINANPMEIVSNQNKEENDEVETVTNGDAENCTNELINEDSMKKIENEVSNGMVKKSLKEGKKLKKKDRSINSLEKSVKVTSKSIKDIRVEEETTEKVISIKACEFTVAQTENSAIMTSNNIVGNKNTTEENNYKKLEMGKTEIDQHLVNSEIKGKRAKSVSNVADEDKSNYLEVIIDLDDYPDDMYDVENNDKDNIKEIIRTNEELEKDKNKDSEEISNETIDHAETWATRYYQTDDVQNVIKESRIQSEIRKRLRERQRLAKLSNSPNATTSLTSTTTEDKNNKTAEVTTTGSIEEYFALKGIATVHLDTSDNNSNSNTISEESAVCDTIEGTVKIDESTDSSNEVDTTKSKDSNTIAAGDTASNFRNIEASTSSPSDTKNTEAKVDTELFPG